MAQDVVPPFTLFTHTRVPLPLVQDVIDYPADLYKNHLLHVVADDCDVEVALRLLDDDIDNGDSCDLDCTCIGDDCSYSCEGM